MGAVVACLMGIALLTIPLIGESRIADSDARDAVSARSAEWVRAVHRRDPMLGDLVSPDGRALYGELRGLALSADPAQLETLHPKEQLQVLFLRHLAGGDRLQGMSESEILHFAVSEGLLGMDLRSSDVLRDVVVEGDRAHGTLFKFGLSERPDRGRQTFVRIDGVWRVDLTGEHERQRSDFEHFVKRSGLPTNEATFFVLEMRLGRKITPPDLVGPLSPARLIPNRPSLRPSRAAQDVLRLVAIRHALDGSDPRAVTIEDRVESLRSVLATGEAVPGHENVYVERIDTNAVYLSTPAGRLELRLEPKGPRLGHPHGRSRTTTAVLESTLLEIAELGEKRSGLMAQWRNVGLRDRALLLQQGSLTPILPDAAEASSRLLGLRVDRRADASFWHQIGLEPQDVLMAVNGQPLDSLGAWQRLLTVAEEEQSITIALRRDGRSIQYQTRTIPPR